MDTFRLLLEDTGDAPRNGGEPTQFFRRRNKLRRITGLEIQGESGRQILAAEGGIRKKLTSPESSNRLCRYVQHRAVA